MNRTIVFYIAVVLLVELLLAPVGSLSSATVATVVGTKTDGGFVTLKTFHAAVTATGALGGATPVPAFAEKGRRFVLDMSRDRHILNRKWTI